MTIETMNIKYPLFTVKSKVQTQGTTNEVGVYLDVSLGDYLGLLFTGLDEAKRFMQRNALSNENEIVEISSESRMVQLARRVRDEGILRTHNSEGVFVLDYGVFGDVARAIPVEEFCRKSIPEDAIDGTN